VVGITGTRGTSSYDVVAFGNERGGNE